MKARKLLWLREENWPPAFPNLIRSEPPGQSSEGVAFHLDLRLLSFFLLFSSSSSSSSFFSSSSSTSSYSLSLSLPLSLSLSLSLFLSLLSSFIQGLLCSPGWSQTSGLKQSSFVNLLSSGTKVCATMLSLIYYF
jgi:hypothetical protein